MTQDELQQELETAANDLLKAMTYLFDGCLTKQDLIDSDTLKTAIKLRHEAQKLGLFDDLCTRINDYNNTIHNFKG